MKVAGWEKWQSYRKDRGTPPWIKVHRNLMTNEEWVSLTDSEKGQLVSLWILAADKDGSVSNNPKVLQRMAMLDEEPNISKFIELGFLMPDGSQGDVNMTTACPQHDVPETETETETEKEKTGSCAPTKRKTKPYPDLFEKLWAGINFPDGLGNKGTKSEAFTEFKKLNPDEALVDAIVAKLAIQAQRKVRQQEVDGFASSFKHVCRILKHRAWEEEIPEAKGKVHRLRQQDQVMPAGGGL